MFTSLLGYCSCNFELPSCLLSLSGMECLLQQFDDCRTMGEDKTTCPFSNGTWVAVLSGGKLFGLLLLGTTSSYKSLLNKSSQ